MKTNDQAREMETKPTETEREALTRRTSKTQLRSDAIPAEITLARARLTTAVRAGQEEAAEEIQAEILKLERELERRHIELEECERQWPEIERGEAVAKLPDVIAKYRELAALVPAINEQALRLFDEALIALDQALDASANVRKLGYEIQDLCRKADQPMPALQPVARWNGELVINQINRIKQLCG